MQISVGAENDVEHRFDWRADRCQRCVPNTPIGRVSSQPCEKISTNSEPNRRVRLL